MGTWDKIKKKDNQTTLEDIDEHLGNSQEVMNFASQMFIELEKHRNEKEPLREVSWEAVQEIVYNNINKRLKWIGEYPKDESEQIAKQCIHIANYAMMLYLKCKENEI